MLHLLKRMSLSNSNSLDAEVSSSGVSGSTEGPPAEPVTAADENSGRVESAAGDFNAEDYQCPVCLETFIDPVQSDCHHRFCDYCLRQWFRTRGNKYCPVCRSDIMTVDILHDMNVDLERQLLQHMSRAQLAERERTRRQRLYDLSRRPNPVHRPSSPYSTLLQEEMFPVSNNLDDDPWTWHVEPRNLDEAEILQSSRPMMEGITLRATNVAGATTRRRHPAGQDSHRHFHHWVTVDNSDQQGYSEYIHLTPSENDFSPDMSFPMDVNDQIRATTQRLSVLNTFLAETVGQGQSPEDETEDEEQVQGSTGSDPWDEGQIPEQSGEEQINPNSNGARNNNRSRFMGRRRRRRNATRGTPWAPPSVPETSYEEDMTPPLAPTPSQQILIEEFHARFQETEDAISAVENAQAQLNHSGEHLRRIFDQCMSAGLDPDRNFGGFSRTPQRTPSLENAPFLFEAANPRGSHPVSRSSRPRLIPTEHHYDIWSTYLTPGYDSLPEEPGHSHHGFHGMWYQRFLHNYPTGYPTHHTPTMMTNTSSMYAMDPSPPHLYSYHPYANVSHHTLHQHPPPTALSHSESAPRYFGHHGVQPQPVRHPNPSSFQNTNSQGNENPRNQTGQRERGGHGPDWENTMMPNARRGSNHQRSSGYRLNQAVQEAIRSSNTLTGIAVISDSGNASESQEESSNEQHRSRGYGSNINILHIDHHVMSPEEEEESEPDREVSVEYEIQLFN